MAFNPISGESVLQKMRREREERAARQEQFRNQQTALQVIQSRQAPNTIQPSLSPGVPQQQQAAFQAQQTAQGPARLPFGRQVSVGAPTAATETRGKPEFGSFFGSGVLENLAGGGLAALENMQKGIEAFGGTAASIADLAPGSLFASQNKGRGFNEILREVSAESGRGSFGDVAGQAQNLAEAFRRTDMPSMKLDIVPGQGIDLPGDSYLNEISIGVKGAMELLPDALLVVGTGGASLAATGSRFGLAKAIPKIAYRTLGADIPVSLARKVGRVITNAPEITKALAPVRKNITNITFNNARDRIDRMSIAEVRDAINRLPSSMKDSVSGVMSRVSPAALIDSAKPSIQRLLYGRLNAYSLIPGGVEANMAVLGEKVRGLGNLPQRQSVEAGFDVGRRVSGSRIGRAVGKVRDKFVGPTDESPVFHYDKQGLISVLDPDSPIANLHGRAWVDVVQSTYKCDFNTIRQGKMGLGGSSKGWVPVSADGTRLDKGDIDKPFDRWVVGVDENGGILGKGSFDKAFELRETERTKVATFARHYLETVESQVRHYESTTGKVIIQSAKSRFVDGFYAPQVPTGGDWFKEVNDVAGFRKPGDKTRPFKERSVFGDSLQEAINEGHYELAGPMESLQSFMTNMYASTIDGQMGKAARVVAKTKKSGVIDLHARKRHAGAAIALIRKGEKKNSLKNIKKIRANGFSSLADGLENIRKLKNPEKRKAALDELKEFMERDVIEIKGQFHSIAEGQRVGPALAGIMFENEKVAKSVAEAGDLVGKTTATGVSEWFAQAGDLLRVGKTGFDFGFHLIHGLPALGLATGRLLAGNVKESKDLYSAWGKSVGKTFDAFFRPETLMKTLMKDTALVQEFVEHGGQISRAAQDYFIAIQNGTLLKRMPKAGEKLDSYFSQLAASFERAFVAPGDLLRIEGYRALRNTASQTENGLEELAGMMNKMTGALSSSSFGVARSQQQVERGFLFFSPRYTRSAMALLSDVYRGGLRGELARQSMAGMVFLGAAGYIGFAKALKQEPVLDPSDSRFMTVEIDDDRIGIGGFWTQFLRVTSRVASTAWDEDAQEAFGDTSKNPLTRWVRSRAAPGAGVAWDIVNGQDFMGRTIESPVDWAKHAGRQTLPIWLEAAVIEDPYRVGPSGLASEIFGARTRALSSRERRQELRDTVAVDSYDKEWDELNDLERKRLESGTAPNITAAETENLAELSELVRSQRTEVGDEVDANIEKWYVKRGEIDRQWSDDVNEGIDYLSEEGAGVDLGLFRKMYLGGANTKRRVKMDELNDENGDYAPTLTYFNEMAEKFGEDHPEDVAYSEYITNIIATDAFDDPNGFDFSRRDDAILAFQKKWGDEVFAYVQEIFATGRDQPPIVQEFYKGREKFEFYWRDVEQATLAKMPRAGEVGQVYQQWLEEDDNGKEELEEQDRLLKKYLKDMKDVRKRLRENDPLLDAWLFRWGFVKGFANPQNVLAPDGISNPREYWRQPESFPLSVFGISEGGIELAPDVVSLQPLA